MVHYPSRTVVHPDYSIPCNTASIVQKKRSNARTIKLSHNRTVKPSKLSPPVAFFVLRPCRTKPTLSGEVRNGMKEEAKEGSNSRTLLISVPAFPASISDVFNVRACNLFPSLSVLTLAKLSALLSAIKNIVA